MNNTYKTKLCRNFMSADGCSRDTKCRYAHGEQELRVIKKMYYISYFHDADHGGEEIIVDHYYTKEAAERALQTVDKQWKYPLKYKHLGSFSVETVHLQ